MPPRSRSAKTTCSTPSNCEQLGGPRTTVEEGSDTYMSFYLYMAEPPKNRDNFFYWEGQPPPRYDNVMTWWVEPKEGGGR